MNGSVLDEREQLFMPFAAEIDDFYRDKFGYKTSCASPRFPTVDVKRSAVQLYLRFRPGGFWPDDSVVIASIGFQKQRCGHGTELLKKLVEMSDRYELRSIGIEQTGASESIQNFVRKFEFKNHRNDRNWLVSVQALKEILASSPSTQNSSKRKARSSSTS
jgi:hypothetical protein